VSHEIFCHSAQCQAQSFLLFIFSLFFLLIPAPLPNSIASAACCHHHLQTPCRTTLLIFFSDCHNRFILPFSSTFSTKYCGSRRLLLVPISGGFPTVPLAFSFGREISRAGAARCDNLIVASMFAPLPS
jgi:hypothetical protein